MKKATLKAALRDMIADQYEHDCSQYGREYTPSKRNAYKTAVHEGKLQRAKVARAFVAQHPDLLAELDKREKLCAEAKAARKAQRIKQTTTTPEE